ncbi:tetratricopeptide repeat protein [Phototrophicus methaneseepsis]|uniref:Tetratricopeptide repeat protein n=1 Tax=Phototrophicus methaneseepsis TaxID=2710758 RepID=A0A7S8IFA7_9CHLR|nr:tetratricopeptide repeat protein [Phototrophicus methaneseepsis]QPC84540.1 tetratricopeptide repeat protein [Phototrophicus methaneseepsis]
MKTKTPVVRQTSWLLAIPQFVILGLLVVTSVLIFGEEYGVLSAAFGAVIYLTYSYVSRFLLLRHHRQGRKLTDQKNYEEAIQAFKLSYDFFSKYSWVDRFRYLTMMTPSHQTFREMALINIAYCYGQLGEKDQTKAYYERTLREFPESVMAQVALEFIQTIETTS